MKPLLTAITATALLLSAGVAAASTPPSVPETTQARPKYELKGIALGDDIEAVKAGLPGADCETFGDGSAAQCYVEKTTIAEKPASLLVRFLDGKVIYVSLTQMTQQDAYAAGAALKIKYGPSDLTNERRATIVRRDGRRMGVFEIPVWKVDGLKQVLFVEPAAYTDEIKQFTYAAINMLDQHLHNDIWMARKEGRASAASDL